MYQHSFHDSESLNILSEKNNLNYIYEMNNFCITLCVNNYQECHESFMRTVKKLFLLFIVLLSYTNENMF